MGSFNETCAISGLAILPGDKVKLLFLVRNPFAVNCDQKYIQRGCYHNDQWYLRTPPVNGIYDDYGNCKIEDENNLITLITDLFQKDLVEQPFGLNRYHAGFTPKNSTFNQIVELSKQGRLLVKDAYYQEEEPINNFPTWKKVLNLLSDCGLPTIYQNVDDSYNAQQIRNGIIMVDFHSYNSNGLVEIQKAQKVLEKVYDCKIIWQEHLQGKEIVKTDFCLLVVAKGGLDNPSILLEPDRIKVNEQMQTHPVRYGLGNKDRVLPVSCVMVRQDVWSLYCKVKYIHNKNFTVAKIRSCILKIVKNKINKKENLSVLDSFELKQAFVFNIPFQVMLSEHLKYAFELFSNNKIAKDDILGLISCCAEAIRVEFIMSSSFISWTLVPTSGQDASWKLKLEINKGLTNIIIKEIKKEEE